MVASEIMVMELKVLAMVLSLPLLKWLGEESLQQRKTSHHSLRMLGLLNRVLDVLYCCIKIEQDCKYLYSDMFGAARTIRTFLWFDI